MQLFRLSLYVSCQDFLCTVMELLDCIRRDREVRMGRPDLIKMRYIHLQMLQTPNILIHIPV